MQSNPLEPPLSPSVLLSKLAPADVAAETTRFLVNAYSEPQRHYHTLQHVKHMLESLHGVQPCLNEEMVMTVELAIWFHDCVYDPYVKEAGKNERDSMEKWSCFASKMASLKAPDV